MDFFASQEQARRKTGLLVFYFLLAVGMIILSVYLVVSLLFLSLEGQALWDWRVLAGVAIINLIIILAGSLFKIAMLRQGGSQVAELMGGRPVAPNTLDFHEKRLLNVVQEMALASGVPAPPVYVMDDEKGINAFAAGYHPDDAVVSVTRGTLNLLNREELQGVLAHEFSHILNGDMRLNIRLMGLLHGILILSLIGRILLRSARYSGRGKKGSVMPLLGLALMIIGLVGVFFGKLIKSAVSRQREYLADASAVQFTRNPPGLAGALKKIGGLIFGSRLEAPHAEEVSHMFFSNALRAGWVGLLSTHPPLVDRIRRLEPGFDGEFPKVSVAPGAVTPAEPSASGPPIQRLAPATGPAAQQEWMDRIGRLKPESLGVANQLLSDLPEELKDACRDPLDACALVFFLLLNREPDLRARQMANLHTRVPPRVYDFVQQAAARGVTIRPEWRLPLVDLAMPALKTLSPAQNNLFRQVVDALVRADASIDLFEYTLQHILLRRLETPGRARVPESSLRTLAEVQDECSIMLSLLVRLGYEAEEDARRAFEQATAPLGSLGCTPVFLGAEACTLGDVDRALRRLARLRPLLKKSLIRTALACLHFDRRVTVEESELFRAIAEALDCPVPAGSAGG